MAPGLKQGLYGSGDGGGLVGCRGRVDVHPGGAHRGMFPCLRFGPSTRLVSEISNAFTSQGRVSSG